MVFFCSLFILDFILLYLLFLFMKKWSFLLRVRRGFGDWLVFQRLPCGVLISDWLVRSQNKRQYSKKRHESSSFLLFLLVQRKKSEWSVGCFTQCDHVFVQFIFSAFPSHFAGFRWFYILNYMCFYLINIISIRLVRVSRPPIQWKGLWSEKKM